MSARHPVEGFTVEPDTDGYWRVCAPSGKVLLITTPNGLVEDCGIPLPPEPRTGRLGLNEADTRATAALFPVEGVRLNRAERVQNAAITMCREDVAEWDAQPEPDTLTVTLPIELVRRAAKWLYPDIGNACHAALDAAGLA